MAEQDDPPVMTRERMRADLAHILRVAPEEVGDGDDLGDLGLDSLRAMNILLRWSDAGLDLDFSELAKELTLDAWWAVAQRTLDRRSDG